MHACVPWTPPPPVLYMCICSTLSGNLYFLQIGQCFLRIFHCRLSNFECWLSIICYGWPLIFNCQLSILDCPLSSTINHQSSTNLPLFLFDYWSFVFDHWQLEIGRRLIIDTQSLTIGNRRFPESKSTELSAEVLRCLQKAQNALPLSLPCTILTK